MICSAAVDESWIEGITRSVALFVSKVHGTLGRLWSPEAIRKTNESKCYRLDPFSDHTAVKLWTVPHTIHSIWTHSTHSCYAVFEDTYVHSTDEAPTDAIDHSVSIKTIVCETV